MPPGSTWPRMPDGSVDGARVFLAVAVMMTVYLALLVVSRMTGPRR